MMNILRIEEFSVPAVALLLCIFSSSHALDENELLISISDEELAQVEEENDWFLKDQLYFASRHRIVRVDPEALKSTDPMTMSLFPDLVLTLQRDSYEAKSDAVVRWSGRIVAPSVLEMDLANPDKESLASFDHIRITGLFYDQDRATGQSFARRSSVNIQGFKRPEEPSRLEESAFLTISKQFVSPALDGVYRIKSLEATPQYHLVYQVDESRSYEREALNDPVRGAEQKRRLEQHLAHKASIGEGPIKEWAARNDALEFQEER